MARGKISLSELLRDYENSLYLGRNKDMFRGIALDDLVGLDLEKPSEEQMRRWPITNPFDDLYDEDMRGRRGRTWIAY
jgi:hypothetical protein